MLESGVSCGPCEVGTGETKGSDWHVLLTVEAGLQAGLALEAHIPFGPHASRDWAEGLGRPRHVAAARLAPRRAAGRGRGGGWISSS